MRFDELERRFRAGEWRPPGIDAQLRMSPRPRRGWKPGENPPECRQGGVLLLAYPVEGVAHVLLTLRRHTLPNHAGQVSLPGGAVEDGETTREAALREAHEEVGVDPSLVRVLGELTSLHVPVSRFVLHPWVAIAEVRPRFVADTREVERMLEVPIGDLRDPSKQSVFTRDYRGREIVVPYFDVFGERLWGATAMVMAEFLDCF